MRPFYMSRNSMTDSSLSSFQSAHDNDVKEASKSKAAPSSGQLSLPSPAQPSPPASAPPAQGRAASSQQLLFQPAGFAHLSQHQAPLSQLHMLAEAPALGPVMSHDYLQSHRMGLLSGTAAGGPLHSFPGLASGPQPGVRGLPLQAPLSVQMAVAGEPRHCLSVAYPPGYLPPHRGFAASCFDR